MSVNKNTHDGSLFIQNEVEEARCWLYSITILLGFYWRSYKVWSDVFPGVGIIKGSLHVLQTTGMELPGKTVEELIYYWGRTESSTEAFVSLKPDSLVHPTSFQRRALSRIDLLSLCRAFAVTLREAEIGKGDVVCVALGNCLERVVVDLGIICLGAIALNGQILRADGEDFLQALRNTKARAVVLDPEQPRGAWTLLQQHASRLELDADVQCPSLPHLRRVVPVRLSAEDGEEDFLAWLRGASPAVSLERPAASPSDVAVIWATSGSTGFSKLVTQTHGNLLHIALQVRHIARLAPGEKIVNCSPLGWAGGFPLWFLGSGATRVFLDTSRGSPRDVGAALWRAAQRERCHYVFTTPMYISSVLQEPELWRGEDRWRPRGINLVGQPMKRSLIAAVVGHLCRAVDINYGTTECGVIATLHLTDAEDYKDGLTGPPAVGVEVRIVGEDGEDVPAGVKGEIFARSPALHGRYVDNEEAERKSFTADPEPWFRTDDVGYLRQDNQIVHLGRRSDAIIRGAYLCYPGWLESLLRRCPRVKDVCVVPVPDPVLHHEICACVVPVEPDILHEASHADGVEEASLSSEGLDGESVTAPSLLGADIVARLPTPELERQLRAFGDSLLLTHPGEALHQTPKYYVMLTALPVTATGKVIRKDVRNIAQRLLGLGEPNQPVS